MNTAFMIMSQYGAKPIIPAEIVARDFFGLSKSKFFEMVKRKEISLPIIRMSDSQKSPRGVHVMDLVEYIDTRRDKANKSQQGSNGDDDPYDLGCSVRRQRNLAISKSRKRSVWYQPKQFLEAPKIRRN
ncbi:MAG: pyocin activator PrtN family protein [Aliishimia sp.]